MAIFTNKKQQVFDLKLTSYGHYLFSIGRFAPAYYAFLDDNVLYDAQYAGITEKQNNIDKRIKDETQYLGSLVLFEDVQKNLDLPSQVGAATFFEGEVTPMMQIPRKDAFKFTSIIGDAKFDGETSDRAPAWKAVVLTGLITSAATEDTGSELKIPQINVELNYTKTLVSPGENLNARSALDILDTTTRFSDNQSIQLVREDALIYLEEQNTELLTENFDVEVFEIVENTSDKQYNRKYFRREEKQIVDGFMISPTPIETTLGDLQTSSVEYYFNMLVDQEVNQNIACAGAEEFNKESYYIDLDFDCSIEKEKDIYMPDIYGKVTEPEICP